MTRLEHLEQEITALPVDEFVKLRNWILERDWAEWDKQIEKDAASVNLIFLWKKPWKKNVKEDFTTCDASNHKRYSTHRID